METVFFIIIWKIEIPTKENNDKLIFAFCFGKSINQVKLLSLNALEESQIFSFFNELFIFHFPFEYKLNEIVENLTYRLFWVYVVQNLSPGTSQVNFLDVGHDCIILRNLGPRLSFLYPRLTFLLKYKKASKKLLVQTWCHKILKPPRLTPKNHHKSWKRNSSTLKQSNKRCPSKR